MPGLGPNNPLKKDDSRVSWQVTKAQDNTGAPTHVVSHMRSDQRIQHALQVQAPFSLCPSSSFLRVLLAVNRFAPRQRQGDTERAVPLSSTQTPVLDPDAHGQIGTMGCLSVGG